MRYVKVQFLQHLGKGLNLNSAHVLLLLSTYRLAKKFPWNSKKMELRNLACYNIIIINSITILLL